MSFFLLRLPRCAPCRVLGVVCGAKHHKPHPKPCKERSEEGAKEGKRLLRCPIKTRGISKFTRLRHFVLLNLPCYAPYDDSLGMVAVHRTATIPKESS